jgi:hypothetical protein
MPTDASNVCLSGKTGSDERALKTALLIHFGHVAPQTHWETNALIPRQRPTMSLTPSPPGYWLPHTFFCFGPGAVMLGNGISRGMGIAVAALSLGAFNQPAKAGWFDSATGQPVQTIPLSSDPNDPTANVNAFRTPGGPHANVGSKNLYYDKECGGWRGRGNRRGS